MEINYKEKLADINAFIFDVDGVLTDGSLIISESGELLRTMNVKDGFAMKFAVDNGYKIGIISGGTNESVRKRLNGLGIEEIHLKSHDKIVPFKTNTFFITPTKIAFNQRKKYFIRRPCLQIDMNKEMYVNIKKRLGYE